MSCSCACHVTSGSHAMTCTVDTGSSGVPGVPSCSPCDGTGGEADRCDRCGARPGEPHSWVESDCVLPHRNHSTKLVAGAHVCEPCVERHRDWLGEITDLYATLPTVVLAGSVPDQTAEHKRPKKGPASPSPLRLDAWAMLHPEQLNAWVKDERTGELVHTGLTGLPDVPAVLAGWAQACHDALGWTSTAPDTVTGAAAVLRGHGEDMARLPDIDTYDAELRWLRKSLRDAHGLAAPKPLGACITVTDRGECGGMVWATRDGDNRPRCDRCTRRYGTLDLVRLQAMKQQAEAGAS